MSESRVYLSEMPGWSDPELDAALAQVARVPESLALPAELWENVLSLIEQQTRTAREARDLPTGPKHLTRGWAVVDPAPIQFLAPPLVSFQKKESEAPAGFLKFPAIIERDTLPASAPEAMKRAVLARPEVRSIHPALSPESYGQDARAQIASILSRAEFTEPEDHDRAEFIRAKINGRGIDHFGRDLAAIRAALELGRKIGRAEILNYSDVDATLAQGSAMEGKGKAPTGLSSKIDKALDEIAKHPEPDFSADAVREIMGIRRCRNRKEIQADDPDLDKLLENEIERLNQRFGQRLKQRTRARRNATKSRGH